MKYGGEKGSQKLCCWNKIKIKMSRKNDYKMMNALIHKMELVRAAYNVCEYL